MEEPKQLTEREVSERAERAISARVNRSPWYLDKLDAAILRAKMGPGWWRR